ncbi:MAG: hypothetical protein A2044_01515, partial [Candidatus Firestonebacteria bacterium GWA2_43_8]
MPKLKKLTDKQVVDKIMSLVKYLPDAVKNLPDKLKDRSTWEKVFNGGKEARQAMDILREIPAFTYMAPKKESTAAWAKVFSKHMGLAQVQGMLQGTYKHANTKPTKRRKIRYWRDTFGKSEVVQRVRPEESDEYIHNPHRGTTTFQRFQGEAIYPSFITADTFGPVTFPRKSKIRDNINFIPRTTLTYCRWPWAWLEPQKGKFRWDIIDNTLRAARNAGQTAQIRFQPYTEKDSDPVLPSETYLSKKPFVNAPRWLWKAGVLLMDKCIYTAFEPDNNDPLYIKHFGEFVKAFGQRYDGHPDLESIDVAYGGYWGEGGGNCTDKTAAKLVDIYLKYFKKTQLVFMLGTKGMVYGRKKTLGTKRHIGFRADCIGDLKISRSPDVPKLLAWNHTYDAYPKEIEECGAKNAWQTAPVTMETCGNVATWVMNDFDLDVIMREGYRYHTSVFMPKNVFYPEKALVKMAEFDKKIGYRFVLRQILLPVEIKSGGKINLEVFTDNVGVAPIYRDYKAALRFTQGKKTKIIKLKEDIREWLP